MKKNIRRRIFYLLILVFVLVSPLLIAYTLGYTFDFSKKTIEKVGGIFIKSKTSRLLIFLNNRFEKETSLISKGALLTGIAPGNYLLRVEKIGYRPWSKTVSVTPTIVTELRNILLVPDSLEISTSTLKEAGNFGSDPAAAAYQIDRKKNLIARSDGEVKTLANDVKYFGLAGDKIFFVSGNGFLARLDPLQGSIETLGRPGFYMGNNAFRFIGAKNGLFAVIDSANGIYLPDPSSGAIVPFDIGVVNARFNENGDKLLLVKDYGIDVVWLEDDPHQPFQKKGARDKILEIESGIQDARWYFEDDAHIVIRSKDGLYVTELDGRGGRNTFELYAGRTNDVYTAPDSPNAIFFKKNKNVYKIEL